jgi:hypothetical protein
MSVNEDKLQALLDKQEIAEIMITYCRAIDHRDEELLRSIFHPDARHHHGFEGPSSDPARPTTDDDPGDFVRYALGVLATHTHTHHQLGNIKVDLEGDTAYTEAYFTAFHRMRANTDPKAAANAYDTEMDLWVGGRYMDRMERRDGAWKIARRIGTTDWQRIDPPTSQNMSQVPAKLRSNQSRDDLVYHRKEHFEHMS